MAGEYFGVVTDRVLENIGHITDIPEECFDHAMISFGETRPDERFCRMAINIPGAGNCMYLFYGKLSREQGGTMIRESSLIGVYSMLDK